MRLIVGLGNPGVEYARTRHNVGWGVIDSFVDSLGAGKGLYRFRGQLWGPLSVEGQRVILLKPLTYMNESGLSLLEVMKFYRLELTDLLVLYDDVDLPPGRLRFRTSGSAGGHNGMKSIIARLGSSDFARLRVGVGAKPSGWNLADHVLGKFSEGDRSLVDEAISEAARFSLQWLSGDRQLMNRVNSFRISEGGGE